MSQDSRIDAYIGRSAPFARPVLAHLRAVVHREVPDALETIKWSRPFFTLNGTLLCAISGFKAHCSFGVFGAEAAATAKAAGVDRSGAMGSFGRITSVGGLPPDSVLASVLKAAADAIRAGSNPMARRRPSRSRPLPRPPKEFSAALRRAASARRAFEALSPSHRREYLEWIIEAKRPETRERRVTRAVEWLSEGKALNWKYER